MGEKTAKERAWELLMNEKLLKFRKEYEKHQEHTGVKYEVSDEELMGIALDRATSFYKEANELAEKVEQTCR